MAHADTLKPPSRLLFALELRALPELGGFVASLPLLTALAPRGDGHPVLVLPGLVTSDRSTVALRSFLKSKAYAAYGWDLGRNYGPLPGVERKMVDRLKALADKHGRKVSLVGWSLGGIYARQLAKMLPDEVRLVIIVAQAAVTGSPCPSDAALARAYGTQSARRARRLLSFFEERGLAVLRTDFHGRRVVAFPDLGCETAPGDPNRVDDVPEQQAAE